MQRRFLLTVLCASGAALGLASCGFELRKAPNFPFKTLFMPFSETSILGVELKRSLEANGTVRVIADPRQIDQADVILDLLEELRDKVVVSRNAAGLVREFQLRLRFRFRVRTPQGKELISNAEILQHRDISFNESAVLAKESEEALLYREMQSDLVQQIMRRLAAISGI
ncbi:MAG: rare lipoprotein [Polaromonas sp.]|nr:rare lipoprotein [Polaromonas sp.]